ncbi:HAMP domain-containing sensor histidine kinase [Sulfurihydrogenibium sp.]|uniref:HAMP domain-containing sensor histidine kinase n=1 Tax=Sulfurihydrogenibium sp. TaxID=2053621 RepID=UPI002606AF46|nr:HAMP domain-containing sensor histidine kinase [Sulfurihydrogenibium sp.]
MFSNLIKFFSRITIKIILLYSFTLLTSLLISFFMVYSFFEIYLENKTKDDLIEKAKAYKILYKQEGLSGLKNQIIKEAEIIKNVEIFFKIYDKKGEIILNTNTGIHTKNLVINLENYGKLNPDTYILTTVDYFDIIIYKLSNKHILVIGKSKLDNNKLLNRLTEIFYKAGTIVFLLSLVGGILITTSITKKIKNISNTAKDIATSMKLDRRVPITGTKDELNDLALLINDLLDRIEQLVKTLKETTESIAHDLKTPIARIRSSTENLLIKNNLSTECSNLLVYIIEETNSLNQMIEDLLTLSKLESGTFVLQKEKINLSNIVKKLYNLFKDYALTKSITLKLNITDEIYINGNEKYISRAIANLIDNAIKFNKENGEVVIYLYEDQENVILKIEDTGIGIPEDKLDKIFEKFYRVDESRGVYSGSGLGLSLVKAILQQHDASIELFSKENLGTTIVITFPKITNL